MHPNYTPAHAQALAQERVVSTAINAFVPAGIIWFLDVTPPQALIGSESILKGLVPGAGVAIFAMTLILTMIVRTRVAKGGLPAFDWPRSERGFYRFIPQNLLLRAITLGVLAAIIFVPVGFVVVAATGILPLTKLGALVFNILYGGCVGLFMTSFVVLPALSDGTTK